MENITASYLARAEFWLFITTLMYFLINGAQIFETAVLIPKWTAEPPKTFKLLADKNGVSLKTFWIAFHSLHEITFIITLIFCWKLNPIRNWLLVLFVTHFAVRVWTLAYFAPKIIDFQELAGNSKPDKELESKVSLWQTLNYIRVAIFVAVSLGLIPLYITLLNF